MPPRSNALFAQDIHRSYRGGHQGRRDKRDRFLPTRSRSTSPTESICQFLSEFSIGTLETPNQPHEGVGVWVSGFFGSGKSSFAKLLGVALDNTGQFSANQPERGSVSVPRAEKIQALLDRRSTSFIPTHPRDLQAWQKRKEDPLPEYKRLTEIMYSAAAGESGLCADLDLAELRNSRSRGRANWPELKLAYEQLFEEDLG